MSKKKIEITQNQMFQFNRMLLALKTITQYQSPEKLKKDSEKDWGLGYEEALEGAYDNIQQQAKSAVKGIKGIKPKEEFYEVAVNKELSRKNIKF